MRVLQEVERFSCLDYLSIMTKICTVYFFAPIPITGLRTMSHCIEKMRKRGNRGLGQVSEGYGLIGVEISEDYSLMMF